MWQIVYYERDSGDIPIEQFIVSLDKRMQTKLVWEISLLKEFGNELKMPYTKHIKDGIFELRTQFATDITRVFYFFFSGNKIVLTNGFIKKTQKIPKGEFDKAVRYKTDYERRHKQ